MKPRVGAQRSEELLLAEPIFSVKAEPVACMCKDVTSHITPQREMTEAFNITWFACGATVQGLAHAIAVGQGRLESAVLTQWYKTASTHA